MIKKKKNTFSLILNKNLLFLLFLLLITLLSRFLLVKDGLVPFQFDHGKDSLAVMDMWLNKTPKLIGPWTSIPGLYFGPGWYYLILPSFLFGNWHPMSPVFLMIFLQLIQIYLAYRFLGKEEAIMITAAPLWIMVATSAWNPFPMTLISLLILILIKKFKEKKAAENWELFLISLIASLAFHFSTAFAIFYPFFILFSLFNYRIKISFRRIFIMFVGFLIPFVPQIIFEFRHDFIELRAIINYLKIGESQNFNLFKINQIVNAMFDYFKSSVLPTAHYPNLKLFNQLAIMVLFFSILKFVFNKSKAAKNKFYQNLTLPKEYLLWIILPIFAYSFLHFNIWYILALTPIFIMLMGDILRAQSKYFRLFYFGLLFVSLFLKISFYFTNDRDQLNKVSAMFKPKMRAIELIRDDAKNFGFNSYHYAPDIYDFSYQYLYFWQALDNKKLPSEFSYKKNEISYVVQKNDLLKYFKNQQSVDQINVNYYIVEPAVFNDLLQSWWNDFDIDDPTNLKEIHSGSDLKIYKELNPI